jgi:hypothetical protein
MSRSSLPVARHRAHVTLPARVGLSALVLVILGWTAFAHGLAAPVLQEQRPVIAQPEQDAVVRGVVQIVGTATHPDFQRYELYYTPWPVAGDNAWIFIGPDAHFQQQPLGVLGTWDSRAVPDGTYGLRVRVVRKDGNYFDSDPRRVTVANVRQPDTPTPEPSPTETPGGEPTELPTMEPTATIMVELPGQSTPTALVAITTTVTPEAETATPEVASILPSGSDSGDVGGIMEGFSLESAAQAARRAAIYTVGAFAAVGMFFGVKALLVWAWHRMRP